MELSDRKKKILRAIVDLYIRTAEPVASKTIAQMPDMDFSSATIRNEMADLTTLGYLEQPHTSAGRIPSPAGYRLYVDELMQDYRLSTDEAKGYEDGTVMNVPLPSVVARPGYTFVGWVDEKGMHEPKWDAQTKVIQVEIPDDPTLRTTTLFAEFMDDEGNGYCSCGASEAGFFSDRIEELKSNDSSTANEGQAFIKRNLPLIYLIAIELAFAAGMFIRRESLKHGKPSSVPAVELSNDDNDAGAGDAVQPSDAKGAKGSGEPDSADSE